MLKVVSLDELPFWRELAKEKPLEIDAENFNVPSSSIVMDTLNFEEVEALLDGGEKCLLIYKCCITLIKENLNPSSISEDFLNVITMRARKLVHLYANNRENLSLINANDLSHATSDGINKLLEFGLNLGELDFEEEEPIKSAISLNILNNNPKLSRAFNHLQGCSLYVDNDWIGNVINNSLRDISEIDEERASLKNRIAELDDENLSIKKELDECRTQLHESKVEAKLNLVQVFELQEDLSEQLLEAKGLKIEIELFKKKTSNLQGELEKYYVQFEKGRELQFVNQGLSKEIKDLKSRVKVCDEKNKAISTNERKLEVQLRGLELKCKKMQSSLSWKISRPLRAISIIASSFSKSEKKLKEDVKILNSSELFNADWYKRTYADVSKADVEPAEHYLLFGGKEGRAPSIAFNGKWYLKSYPDVASSGINPLIHYLKFGVNEGRKIKPMSESNEKRKKH